MRTEDTFIIAYAVKDGMEDSDTTGFIYTIKKAEDNSTSTTIETTETTTEAATETTTVFSGSSGNSSRGGGSGPKKTTSTTTEATTKSVVSKKTTETTTVETVLSGNVRVTIGSNEITVGNRKFTIDTAPYIQPESNSTLVPLRFVAIAVSGGSLDDADTSPIIGWDANTKTVTITANGNTIKFTSGSGLMYKNNTPMLMENGVKAEIKDGRMFVPFRALGNALGVSVSWNADTKTAIYTAK